MINKLYAMIIFLILLGMIPVDVIYGASIRITWNANQESDLSGYKVYYGTSSGNYDAPIAVGNRTAYEITGLNEGVRYYVSLTAYDTSANESAKSAEISGIAQSSTSSTIITTTLPSSTSTSASSASSTSSVQLVTTTTVPISTTTTAVTTTQLSSTSTTALQPTTTTTLLLTTTTTPITSTQPSSSTSTIVPVTTTTTSTGDEISSCDEPAKLQPFSVNTSAAQRPFFPIGNLIDGDQQTSWATFFTLFKKDASITLDLGSEKTITSLSLYASRIFGIDVLPANIELQISNDNNTWETISAIAESADLESTNADNWRIKDHKCRYLKLCISGRKTFLLFQLAQIAELEIYGCDDATDHPPFSAQSSSSSETVELLVPNESLVKESSKAEPLAPGVPGRPLVSFK